MAARVESRTAVYKENITSHGPRYSQVAGIRPPDDMPEEISASDSVLKIGKDFKSLMSPAPIRHGDESWFEYRRLRNRELLCCRQQLKREIPGSNEYELIKKSIAELQPPTKEEALRLSKIALTFENFLEGPNSHSPISPIIDEVWLRKAEEAFNPHPPRPVRAHAPAPIIAPPQPKVIVPAPQEAKKQDIPKKSSCVLM